MKGNPILSSWQLIKDFLSVVSPYSHSLFSFLSSPPLLQFHADYLKQSRSYLWEVCIDPLLEEDGEITHERYRVLQLPLCGLDEFLCFCSLLQVIDDFEMRMSAGSRPENLVKAVDAKFRKSAQEVHLKYSKVNFPPIIPSSVSTDQPFHL